ASFALTDSIRVGLLLSASPPMTGPDANPPATAATSHAASTHQRRRKHHRPSPAIRPSAMHLTSPRSRAPRPAWCTLLEITIGYCPEISLRSYDRYDFGEVVAIIWLWIMGRRALDASGSRRWRR